MNRFVMIAGLAVVLAAGSAEAQTGQTQPPPPRQGGDAYGGPPPGAGPGQAGPGFGGRRMMGRGGFGMGRGMRGPPPTLADVQRRNAQAFALMDANKDGKVSFEEFRRDLERRKLEREQDMFRRFSGGADSVTLDQLNARAAERMNRGPGGPGGPGRGPGRGPGAPPAGGAR